MPQKKKHPPRKKRTLRIRPPRRTTARKPHPSRKTAEDLPTIKGAMFDTIDAYQKGLDGIKGHMEELRKFSQKSNNPKHIRDAYWNMVARVEVDLKRVNLSMSMVVNGLPKHD